jgi:ribosomal protein L37AE/L43A
MSSQKFIKNIENFTCEKCGFAVEGNGYTNHCPQCLWARHVDVFPGDRAGDCEGMMEPLRVEVKTKEYTIIHKCQKCGVEKPNKAMKDDSFDLLLQISAEHAKRFI